MSINVVNILNRFSTNISKNQINTNYNKNSVVTDNIFAQAQEIVAKYKAQENNNSNNKENNTTNKQFFGKYTATQIANMSSSEFLNYAYENKAEINFKSNTNDESGINLPQVVAYGGYTFSTAGKSFMQIVTKIKGKYPYQSEEKIAAKLIAKYGQNNTTGNSVNISA